jgi:L-iditol 2-dehydrogenase
LNPKKRGTEMKNMQAVMTAVKKMDLIPADIPDIRADEVLVKIKHVGICGSDVHYYETGKLGIHGFKAPLVLGHESAGVIEKIGTEVVGLNVGDKVALEPGIPCRKCEFCKNGKYNICPDLKFMAIPPYNGAFQEYVAHPFDMAFRLPENVSTIEGALIEPLSVGLHAVNQGHVEMGKRIMVLGTGCIGLASILACNGAGASDIYVTDVVDNRLEKAKQVGASATINSSTENAVEKIMDLTNGQGVDTVIECSGNTEALQMTPDVLKSGGTIVLIGIGPKDIVEFNFATVIWKEIEIKSVFRYRNLYPKAIKALAGKRIDVKQIVSHEFAFSDIENAFNTVVAGKSEIIKAIVTM